VATDWLDPYAHLAVAGVFAALGWLLKRYISSFADTQKEQAERLDSHGERIAKIEGFLGLD